MWLVLLGDCFGPFGRFALFGKRVGHVWDSLAFVGSRLLFVWQAFATLLAPLGEFWLNSEHLGASLASFKLCCASLALNW